MIETLLSVADSYLLSPFSTNRKKRRIGVRMWSPCLGWRAGRSCLTHKSVSSTIDWLIDWWSWHPNRRMWAWKCQARVNPGVIKVFVCDVWYSYMHNCIKNNISWHAGICWGWATHPLYVWRPLSLSFIIFMPCWFILVQPSQANSNNIMSNSKGTIKQAICIY